MKVKELHCKGLVNKMRNTFLEWHKHIENKANNKTRGQILRDKNAKKVEKKYFQEWENLYKYYSSFTKSGYCYTQKKLSEMHFQKKWFEILKMYCHMRFKHKSNQAIAD
jgi:hypothetical protein